MSKPKPAPSGAAQAPFEGSWLLRYRSERDRVLPSIYFTVLVGCADAIDRKLAVLSVRAIQQFFVSLDDT